MDSYRPSRSSTPTAESDRLRHHGLERCILGGHDEKTLPFFCAPLYAEQLLTGSGTRNSVLVGNTGQQCSLGDTNVAIEVQLIAMDDQRKVKGQFECKMPDDNLTSGKQNFEVAADQSDNWDVVLDSGGPFADRAHVKITITNIRQD
jgi:hypothetical protein